MPVLPIEDYQTGDRIAFTEEFKKMKPPLFHEGVEPLKAEAWVLVIEKLFEVFSSIETQRVQLAAFTLKDEVSEFEGLKQGNMTVAEYEAKFIELVRFVSHIVDTNYKKARKFEGGLCNAILEKVNVLKLPKYMDVLDRALMSKANLASHNRPFE
ncbi:uncharacterized protein LOC114292257 [Camellia sinensis]|uniref:uncharacterized protein LOC114292257 n=1 Tax=Camellia sinensis TaxID=4442 RepID=UPI0010365F0C|nr:uncharacterized protein LOC114292257 [Camellia sinensis]